MSSTIFLWRGRISEAMGEELFSIGEGRMRASRGEAGRQTEVGKT